MTHITLLKALMEKKKYSRQAVSLQNIFVAKVRPMLIKW